MKFIMVSFHLPLHNFIMLKFTSQHVLLNAVNVFNYRLSYLFYKGNSKGYLKNFGGTCPVTVQMKFTEIKLQHK